MAITPKEFAKTLLKMNDLTGHHFEVKGLESEDIKVYVEYRHQYWYYAIIHEDSEELDKWRTETEICLWLKDNLFSDECVWGENNLLCTCFMFE